VALPNATATAAPSISVAEQRAESLQSPEPAVKADAMATPASKTPEWLSGHDTGATAIDRKGAPAESAPQSGSREAHVTKSPKTVSAVHEEAGRAGTTRSEIHAEEVIQWTARGNAHFGEGAVDDAISAYNKAIQIDATYGVPYSNLARRT
jgi:hypothetical protein